MFLLEFFYFFILIIHTRICFYVMNILYRVLKVGWFFRCSHCIFTSFVFYLIFVFMVFCGVISISCGIGFQGQPQAWKSLNLSFTHVPKFLQIMNSCGRLWATFLSLYFCTPLHTLQKRNIFTTELYRNFHFKIFYNTKYQMKFCNLIIIFFFFFFFYSKRIRMTKN